METGLIESIIMTIDKNCEIQSLESDTKNSLLIKSLGFTALAGSLYAVEFDMLFSHVDVGLLISPITLPLATLSLAASTFYFNKFSLKDKPD